MGQSSKRAVLRVNISIVQIQNISNSSGYPIERRRRLRASKELVPGPADIIRIVDVVVNKYL